MQVKIGRGVKIESSPSSFNVVFCSHEVPFRRWRPCDGAVYEGGFALDLETTLIDRDRPALVPTLVLAAACDARSGWFITAEDTPAFLAAHLDNLLVFHNAAFDLGVLQETLRRRRLPGDIYGRVDRGLVVDTMVLARLIALASVGDTARSRSSLAAVVGQYLGLVLPKDETDEKGGRLRTGFDLFIGRPFEAIPAKHLQYAGADPLATWLVFECLRIKIGQIAQEAATAFGYVDARALEAAWDRHGPLTHNIQLRASIVMDCLSRTGVLVDHARRDGKVAALQAVITETKQDLDLGGIPTKGEGSQTALRKRIQRLLRLSADIHVNYTDTGQIALDDEQLTNLESVEPLFRRLRQHRAASKLLETYLKKMDGRLHARFNFLMNTGRTSCGGGFNLQNLPKERDATANSETTIRGCFVPAPGRVFVVVDYAQIELAVLGWAWKHQLGFGGSLHEIVSGGRDMHRLIAARVLGKTPEDVTPSERNAAKPVSLGRPGGLGANTIRKIAYTEYGMTLTDHEVEQRIRAYEELCPELVDHLQHRVNVGQTIADALRLTPAAYRLATGGTGYGRIDSQDESPADWLGWMLLKVLELGRPVKRETGRQYTESEVTFLWAMAERIPAAELGRLFVEAIRDRRASKALRSAVQRLFSREAILTATGRLRAAASFTACRNGIMQGLAADGAIYALWNLMRAGYKIVNFIHDEVICEVPEDEHLPAKVADIERLMITGMQTVVPGANVRVETEVRRSFSKADKVTLALPPGGITSPPAESAP